MNHVERVGRSAFVVAAIVVVAAVGIGLRTAAQPASEAAASSTVGATGSTVDGSPTGNGGGTQGQRPPGSVTTTPAPPPAPTPTSPARTRGRGAYDDDDDRLDTGDDNGGRSDDGLEDPDDDRDGGDGGRHGDDD